jgi:hypothetical protein
VLLDEPEVERTRPVGTVAPGPRPNDD